MHSRPIMGSSCKRTTIQYKIKRQQLYVHLITQEKEKWERDFH